MPSSIGVRIRIQWLLEQIERRSGQEQIPEIRRAVWRRMWAAPGTVEFVDFKDYSEPVCITTRTISGRGLDFRSSRMPKSGCKLLISLKTDDGALQIPATVVHSTESVYARDRSPV